MQNINKVRNFKKYAYVTVSCVALTGCLGVFEKQPERYNTVLGAKRSPANNPKTQKASVVGTADTRSPAANPLAPNEALTPYDRYPSSPSVSSPTFQSTDTVKEVPLSINTPAYIEDDGFIAATNTEIAEPSPLYYYEQQQAQAYAQYDPELVAPAHVIVENSLYTREEPSGDAMYNASQPVNDTLYQPQQQSQEFAETTAPVQNYVPVIEQEPSPLQQFEPQNNAFPELSSVPPAPNYEKSFNQLRSDAASFANQYSPEIATNLPENNNSQNIPAPIETAPSPIANIQYDTVQPYAPLAQQQPNHVAQSMQPQTTVQAVHTYYEQPEQIADLQSEPYIKEYIPQANQTKRQPVYNQPHNRALPSTINTAVANNAVQSYVPVNASLPNDNIYDGSSPHIAPSPAQQLSYNEPNIQAHYAQPQSNSHPYNNTAQIDYSQQPIILPEQSTYDSAPLEVDSVPANAYVTQSEYSLEEIQSTSPAPAQYQPITSQALPTQQPTAAVQPTYYEQERVATYNPEEHTISVSDAPPVAQSQRVFTSAGPITLTPPPSMRSRRGARIAQSKYNRLRRRSGATRATLRH